MQLKMSVESIYITKLSYIYILYNRIIIYNCNEYM